MNDAQLQAKLAELLALPHETEWVEFKHNNDMPQVVGEYLSAISNSAALESQPFGYIVWGVEDGTHRVVGTSFKPRQKKGQGNEDLEPWLNKLLAPRINFRIFEFESEGLPMVTQRKTFLMNLLQEMRRECLIESGGRGAGSVWKLHFSEEKPES